MKYKELSLGSFKPVGIGRMEVDVKYITSSTSLGIFPVKKSHTDTITYSTYVVGEDYPSAVYMDGTSLRTEKLGSKIPSELFKLILSELKRTNAIDRVSYKTVVM